MQPELTKVSQNAPVQTSPDNTSTSSQHGIHYDVLQASLLHDEEQRASQPSVRRHDAGSPERSPERVASAHEAARLSPTSHSPRNRIADYENAVTNPAKKTSEGLVFEVIKNDRKLDDKSSPIAKLPNGETR